ncbi:MAG TPA: hypothetical protein VMB21_12155 [Candidatus Limnocylindria bacterium]|nr:hypothetical protein [Candidatus Limnocylindria bacterium]
MSVQDAIRRTDTVLDERSVDVVYLVYEPADNYFLCMTQSRRMPALLGRQIS